MSRGPAMLCSKEGCGGYIRLVAHIYPYLFCSVCEVMPDE